MNLGGKVICCGSERLFLCVSNPVKVYDSNIFVLRALFLVCVLAMSFPRVCWPLSP